MSTLDRRVQILLDPEQYAALEREAQRAGYSVAAVIRESISSHLARQGSSRAAAADRLLASADQDPGPAADWSAIKHAMETELAGKFR